MLDEPPVAVLQYEKWGGRPHDCGASFRLGDDEFGTWLWGPMGRTVYRGDSSAFVTEQPSLTLVPPDAWWAISWWLGHPEIASYVNINTPARWNDGRAVSVDLPREATDTREHVLAVASWVTERPVRRRVRAGRSAATGA